MERSLRTGPRSISGLKRFHGNDSWWSLTVLLSAQVRLLFSDLHYVTEIEAVENYFRQTFWIRRHFPDVVDRQVGRQHNSWWCRTFEADDFGNHRTKSAWSKRPFLVNSGRTEETTEEKEKTSKSNFYAQTAPPRFGVFMIWTSHQRIRFKPCSAYPSYKNNVFIVGLASVKI